MDQNDRPSTARAYVREQLRRDIVTGDLQGGTRLVQSAIAERLNVSTTPVREALHDLAAEGFIRMDPHRGAVVTQVEGDDLRELFEIRRVLEPMVIRRAVARASDEAIDRAERLSDKMLGMTQAGEWVEANRDFHGIFMEIAESPRLASMVGSLQDSAAPFLAMAIRFRPEMMKEGNEDHRTLVDAVRRRDVDAAVECIVDHMDVTMRVLGTRLD
jgi:DNA-binding GntR family transcriptional regulator